MMSLLVCAVLAMTASLALSSDSVEVAVRTAPSELSLKYWSGRGLMEVSRFLLAIGGKFPELGDYEDGRYTSPPKGLKSNLGRMPVLSVGAANVGQSAAIHFYLAAENDLMGDSNLEAAQILAIGEHIREMATAYRSLVPYGTEPSESVTSMWFEEGPSDVLGTADASRKGERYLTWWMGRIEQALDVEGYAVGERLSLADVYIYNAFREVLQDDEVADENFPQWRREPFGNYEAMTKKLSHYPRLAASCNAVSRNANVQKWLAVRGKQSF